MEYEYSGKNKADLAEICKKKCSLIPVNFNDSIINSIGTITPVTSDINKLLSKEFIKNLICQK